MMSMSTEVLQKPDVVRVHPTDNVAVALEALAAGQEVELGGERLTLRDDVPAGHKIALREIAEGEPVIKYGFAIGLTTEPIPAGRWIHSHNLRTALSGTLEYGYEPVRRESVAPATMPTFMGDRKSVV